MVGSLKALVLLSLLSFSGFFTFFSELMEVDTGFSKAGFWKSFIDAGSQSFYGEFYFVGIKGTVYFHTVTLI